MRKALASAVTATVFGLVSATSALAIPIQLSVDTSAFAGSAAQIAFDFIDGGSPANTATISGFATDGVLGASATFGDASGMLPGDVTLSDSTFFAEYLQDITLGTQFSFMLDSTGFAADAGMFPDGLSLFLLDPLTGLSLVATSDPTGANALLLQSVGQANGLALYGGAGVAVSIGGEPNTVSEPGSLALAFAGIAAVLLALRRRQRQDDGFIRG